jgi:DNA-binding NarL/FixJ family response regulator
MLSILTAKRVTFEGVATILLAGVDVFFRGKLEALLPGHHLTTTDSIDPPELVICDVSRIEPEEVADAYPEIPILGFTNHTDTAGRRSAHAAGFDQVVAKSALNDRVADLVQELIASVD